MPIKAILFDLDGTLVDTIPFHKKSFQLVFARFGKKLSAREISRYIRWSTDEIYHKLHVKKRIGLDLEKFLQLRREAYYFLICGHHLVFKPRAKLVQKLQKKFGLGLVTNSSVFTAKRSMPSGLVKRFRTIVTFSDVVHGKPAPDMLLLAARKLRAKPSECVMVGDSVVDVLAARAAKMPCIAIHCKTAASTLSDLRREKPAFIVRNARELETVLNCF